MKKLIIISIITLFSFKINAQRESWIDSIGITDITGSDTIIWAESNEKLFGSGLSCDIKFHTLDGDSSEFAIVVSNQDSIYSYADLAGSTIFPDTLSVTDYSYTNEYGNSVASRGYQLDNLLFTKIGIYFKPGGDCTEGKAYWVIKYK